MIKKGIEGWSAKSDARCLRLPPTNRGVGLWPARVELRGNPSRPQRGHAWLLRYRRPARVHAVGRGRRCRSTALDRRCQVGVSGAGRKPEVHILFSEAADNFKAYGVAGHRRLPEILQGLAQAAGHEVGVTFIPHLTPMIRGMVIDNLVKGASGRAVQNMNSMFGLPETTGLEMLALVP